MSGVCDCDCRLHYFFFFKQKTVYELRISDWSSDVCSSDLERYKGIKEKLGEEREKFEDYMERYEQNLSNTFSAMDTKLASLKATQTYLEQQIAMWNNSDN